MPDRRAPRGAIRAALAVVCLVASLLVLCACGGSSATTSSGWSNLRSVSITITRPGLPPPYGEPHTTVFSSSAELSRITAALNANHITKLSAPTTNNACTGGAQVTLKIVKHDGSQTTLSGYRCARQTSGDIGGDLPGLLAAAGITSIS
jgi:hypothetical protein